MQGRRDHRSRWAHANTPQAKRRRRAERDAKREAMAALLPPVPTGPEPLTLWQSFTIELYVPTHGRCDQHAVKVNGEEVGLLSATQVSVLLREKILKRPSLDVLADARRDW